MSEGSELGRSGCLASVEISRSALEHNLSVFRGLVGPGGKIMFPVKAEAYGHGLLTVARAATEAGVDWLAVHSLAEGVRLREAGIKLPILLLGYVPVALLGEVLRNELSLAVYNLETVRVMAAEARARGQEGKVHIKVETGTNRQGVKGDDLLRLAKEVDGSEGLLFEGAYTHFANIEDTTDHAFAMGQLAAFERELGRLEAHGLRPELRHAACSAAAMLFEQTHFDMVRPGISTYGLWPSRETFVSMLRGERGEVKLRPVLSWKTMIAQIKAVPSGEYIGYGCTWRTTRDSRIAVLPVGYSDGYSRALSNVGHVLVRGVRAPVRGRVCMNLTMVDVSDIPGASVEDEVVLLGRQGDEEVSAEDLAGWSGTINYEVVARLNPLMPRRMVA